MTTTALAATIACASEKASPDAASTGTKASTPATAASNVTPAMLARGHEIYKANCVACHGETGKGDGPGAGGVKTPPRDHTDPAYMSTLSAKEIADVIKMGGAMKGKPLMPSHPQFGTDDLNALVAYVRSLSQPATPQ
jgi:mono/diheme cytochrome c family protein